MGPYYEHLCSEFEWMVDDAFLNPLKEANKTKLAALDAAIQGPLDLKQFVFAPVFIRRIIAHKIAIFL